ncbi:universal stress protein [Caballeronia ptereochthonis]|uniref:Universal stress protein n=1 Tax=Caballeronia ptereochthonis TaxID=1777144 RepID=A0A158BA43_9BURK|nr:universal stress protein [Caballeronia ptereochthonis]SAK66237.1 universal stress protein [Caballeronia ptereochthonis]
MYRHLLVPVERSDACVEAIGHAAELARSLGARITFVCGETGEHDALTHRRTEALLARAEAAARAQGVPASVLLDQGGATFDGIGHQASRDYDLVCIAQGSAVPPLAGVAVLVCPADARPSVTRVVGALLDEHRARSDAFEDALAGLRAKRLAQRTIEGLCVAPREEKALTLALRERTSALDAEFDELARLAGREAALLARIAESAMRGEEIEDRLHACARFAWERMGRIEGVVLPASRRCLRDADWSALADHAGRDSAQ